MRTNIKQRIVMWICVGMYKFIENRDTELQAQCQAKIQHLLDDGLYRLAKSETRMFYKLSRVKHKDGEYGDSCLMGITFIFANINLLYDKHMKRITGEN